MTRPAASLVATGLALRFAFDGLALAWAAYATEVSLPFWPINPSISATLPRADMLFFAFQLDILRAMYVILPGAIKPAAVRTIDVVIEDIAAGPDAHVVLDGHWIEGGVSHREHLAVDVPSLDSVNVATGTSQVIAALADRIAAQLH